MKLVRKSSSETIQLENGFFGLMKTGLRFSRTKNMPLMAP